MSTKQIVAVSVECKNHVAIVLVKIFIDLCMYDFFGYL